MADETTISQLISESAADASDARISQEVAESAASNANTRLSQEVFESGAGDANTRISQDVFEAGAGNANTRISQLTIELSHVPTTVPPADSPTPVYAFGLGALEVNYFLVPQLSDSGIELRDKCIKSFRATGKLTNARFQIYGFGPAQEINVDDIEAGVNSRTGPIIMADTSQVAQSKRFPVNVPNSMLWTIRLEGMYPGTGERDRIDEIVVEVAQQGIRR